MKRSIKVIGVVSTVLFGTLFTPLIASAQPGAEQRLNARQDRIVGVWDIQVTVANCVNGTTLFAFPALHQYQFGGTGQVVPASDPAANSAHMMSWTHLSGNDYLSRFKFYRFDAAGMRTGWTVGTNEVSVDENANVYSGTGIVEVFDNNGNLQFASCPSFIGTRFSAEP